MKKVLFKFINKYIEKINNYIDKHKIKRSVSIFLYQTKIKKFFSILVDNNKILVVSFSILIAVVLFFFFQNQNSTSLGGILNDGERYEKSGKIAMALESYYKAVKLYPGSYEAHLRLGNLYRQVNELENAKIEYYRAIKMGNLNRYDAYFAMADIYVSEDEYELAQDILVQIQDIPFKVVSDKIGDFYFDWGNQFKKINQPEAIRKYKLAYKFYSKNKSDKVFLTRKAIENKYMDIADNLLAFNKVDEAVKILNSSINYYDNSSAHYKLARIYEKENIDKAIEEYTKAFTLNSSIASTDGFVQLLVKKADNLYKNGDKLNAGVYYGKARKLGSKVKIPYINDNNIIVNLIASKSSKDVDKQLYTPGISFKITNISKNKIEYLKAKVIFNVNDQKYSEEIKEISTQKIPLSPYSITPLINVYSSKSLGSELRNPKVEIQIFVSQQNPDKWKLFRNTYFDGKNLVNELDKTSSKDSNAVKMSNKNNYSAYFTMADIYISKNEYELAQDLLLQIKDVQRKVVSDKIGDFYFNWGNKISKSDQPEAIRKYKLAYKFYSRNKSDKVILTKKTIKDMYLDLSDKLLAVNNDNEAVKLLNSSIDYYDNATAHYKLARIYEKKNTDKAINEYTKAFVLNSSIASTDGLVQLLVKKADNLYKNGDKTTAKFYYERAKKLNPQVKIPQINDSNIIVNLIVSKFSNDVDKQQYSPGISFKISNISKNKIEYLKAKVVFNVDGKKYSEEIKEISTLKSPLAPSSVTPAININTSKPLSYEYKNPKVEIQIYISQQNPDSWKLFGSNYFVNNHQIKNFKKTKNKEHVISRANNCEAYFAMVDMYVTKNEYVRAQDLLLQIKDVQRKVVSDKIGDFYFNWGNKISKSDQPEAIRKYKLAYKFYSRNKSDKVILTKKTIKDMYLDLSDKLLAVNNDNEAVKLLNFSIDYYDNATAHYKLARIYEKKNTDKAINEYTKAFALNSSIASTDGLVQLLVKKADNLYKNGDKTIAKFYYEKAKKLNPRVKLPYIDNNYIFVSLIAVKSDKDNIKHLYIPGISFKISNISKNKIQYLKAKVVFNVDGKKYSEEIKEISTLKSPLAPSSVTPAININTSKPISLIFGNPKVEILIYVSQQKPDKWKLFRSTSIEDQK
ncbi:MAG: tetratricopeptide repeat protein [Candidatus Gastranaerophilales bacterium]|nr:tetratricopeptide repeat protein [Candidatus Gastranaerophilales bacterium]